MLVTFCLIDKFQVIHVPENKQQGRLVQMNHQEKSAIQKRHDLVLYSVPILDGTHTLNKPQQNNTDLELKPFIKQGNIFKKKKNTVVTLSPVFP